VAAKTSDRDHEILQLLLEHPFLDDGLSAEGAYNYLLGRTHHQKRQERWKQSSRILAYWMKKMGFASIRTGDVNKYSWPETSKLVNAENSE
jgi:hypothetical protein